MRWHTTKWRNRLLSLIVQYRITLNVVLMCIMHDNKKDYLWYQAIILYTVEVVSTSHCEQPMANKRRTCWNLFTSFSYNSNFWLSFMSCNVLEFKPILFSVMHYWYVLPHQKKKVPRQLLMIHILTPFNYSGRG